MNLRDLLIIIIVLAVLFGGGLHGFGYGMGYGGGYWLQGPLGLILFVVVIFALLDWLRSRPRP